MRVHNVAPPNWIYAIHVEMAQTVAALAVSLAWLDAGLSD